MALQDVAALLGALERVFAPLKVDLVVLPRADPLPLKKIFPRSLEYVQQFLDRGADAGP